MSTEGDCMKHVTDMKPLYGCKFEDAETACCSPDHACNMICFAVSALVSCTLNITAGWCKLKFPRTQQVTLTQTQGSSANSAVLEMVQSTFGLQRHKEQTCLGQDTGTTASRKVHSAYIHSQQHYQLKMTSATRWCIPGCCWWTFQEVAPWALQCCAQSVRPQTGRTLDPLPEVRGLETCLLAPG